MELEIVSDLIQTRRYSLDFCEFFETIEKWSPSHALTEFMKLINQVLFINKYYNIPLQAKVTSLVTCWNNMQKVDELMWWN